jgi:chitin disaccharide deacetylase
MVTKTKGRANALLGYPADARLLVINADDFGMCHAVNEAILQALDANLVRSCSLMIPCAWSLHGRKLLRESPQIAFGVHLTAVSEQPDYRWGPVTDRQDVPSLLDEAGYFYAAPRIDEFLERANPAELEQEFRAQIEAVMAAGLQPTHLDSHCGIHNRRDWAFEITLRLARDYGLAVRVGQGPFTENLQRQGYPALDHELLDSYDLALEDKAAHYAQMLRELPVGLSEWAVHPGLGNAELKALMPSWQVRQSDFDFFTSSEAKMIIEQEGIILLNYRTVQEVWRAVA